LASRKKGFYDEVRKSFERVKMADKKQQNAFEWVYLLAKKNSPFFNHHRSSSFQ
jgi:hypothetical protein